MTTRNRTLAASLLLLPVVLLAACDSSSSPPPPVPTSIAVTPAAAISLAVGASRQLTAIAHYGDGAAAPLTAGVTFATSDSTRATVSGGGLVTGVAGGTATITVTETASGETATCTVTVTVPAATLTSIDITPSPASVAATRTLQLTVTGTYSDGSTQNLTSTATFSSTAVGTATVSPGPGGGLVTGVAAGTATITASVGGKTATRDVTVAPAPALTSIAITPNPASVVAGRTLQLTVTGTYSDGVTQNLTSTSTFSSGAPGTATVTAGPGGGLVTGVAVGTATITATVGGQTATRDVTVTPPPTLSSIAITPNPASVATGRTLQLTVTGTYSDGSTQNLTSTSTFSSGAPGTATVTAGPGGGLVTGVALGIATITASVGGQTATRDVTVNPPPTLSSIAITPNPASVVVGNTLQLTVTGTYSDGSTQDLTATATFLSGTLNIATVTPGPGGGLVSSVAVGSSVITASVGILNATVTVTVAATGGPGPTTVATAPTAAAGNVISLFSSTYAGTVGDFSGNVDHLFTPWSCNMSTTSPPSPPPCYMADYTISSHVVKRYEMGTTRDNFFGIDFIGSAGAHEIDITTLGQTPHLHMDVWSPNGNHLVIKLVDAGPDKVINTSDDSSKLTLGGIHVTQNTWQHIDLDINALSVQQAAWTGKNVAQIVVSLDDPPAPVTLYVDNVYFSRSGAEVGVAVAVAPPRRRRPRLHRRQPPTRSRSSARPTPAPPLTRAPTSTPTTPPASARPGPAWPTTPSPPARTS